MMFGHRSTRAGAGELAVYDSFSGGTIDTAKWDVSYHTDPAEPECLLEANRTRILSGKLRMAGYSSVVTCSQTCGTLLKAKAALKTTGQSKVSVLWRPGPKRLSTSYSGYIALVYGTEPYYDLTGVPFSAPGLCLNYSTDSSQIIESVSRGSRSQIRMGFFTDNSTAPNINSSLGVRSYPSSPVANTFVEANEYLLEWIFDWDLTTWSLSIDETEVLPPVATLWTPSAPLYPVLGFCTEAYWGSGIELWDEFDDIKFDVA